MTPLVKAEQAVLGAVFSAPSQLDRLAPWLRPEHFSRPVHAALYAAMLKLRTEGHPALKAPSGGPVPLAWLTDTLTEASKDTRGLTAPLPHQLVSACPNAMHAPVYGRMVLEGAIHRSVSRHATRLHQAARTDALHRGVQESIHHAQILSEVLADLARRWGTEPRAMQPPSPPAVAPEPHQPVDELLLADEEFLLGSLSARPHQLRDIVGWLRPDDFADPGHQQLYHSLGALHHRGEPIDQLTVLWETQRRGALCDGTLNAERVLRICDPLAVDGAAEHFGEQVLRASLVCTAAASARHVRALADEESLAPGQLIGYALHALGPLDEVHRRWRIASGAEPEPPHSARSPGTTPPAGRSDAARSRSRQYDAVTASSSTPTATSPAARPGRPTHRSPT
ncbi:DnaB-like helicase N-terminal domain-containing protein [Actinomycetota bacterium Odt1-20B]